MSLIEVLWARGEVPIDDALHFADGRSYDVVVDPSAPGGFVLADRFDVRERLATEPNWVSVVDGLKINLDGGDLLWHGDGDNGSEGFFARTTASGDLKWVLFLTASNPFTEVELSEGCAAFRSTLGVVIAVDSEDPTRPIGA